MTIPFQGNFGAKRRVEEIRRLAPRWIDKPPFSAILTAIGEEDEALVEAIRAAYDGFVLGTAKGDDLAVLGSNYGLKKPMVVGSDAAFTAFIKALAFKAKTLTARVEEVLGIVLGEQERVGWNVYEIHPNTITIEMGSYRPTPGSVQAGTYLLPSSEPTNPARPGDYLISSASPAIELVEVNDVPAVGYTGVVLGSSNSATVPPRLESEVISLVRAAGVSVEFVKKGS